MVDIYTKATLTVIAIALLALLAQQAFQSASAQIGEGCGRVSYSPCYIQIVK